MNIPLYTTNKHIHKLLSNYNNIPREIKYDLSKQKPFNSSLPHIINNNNGVPISTNPNWGMFNKLNTTTYKYRHSREEEQPFYENAYRCNIYNTTKIKPIKRNFVSVKNIEIENNIINYKPLSKCYDSEKYNKSIDNIEAYSNIDNIVGVNYVVPPTYNDKIVIKKNIVKSNDPKIRDSCNNPTFNVKESRCNTLMFGPIRENHSCEKIWNNITSARYR